MKKMLLAAAAAIGFAALAQPASAATIVVTPGGSGTLVFTENTATAEFGNAFTAATASFSNIFGFTLLEAATLTLGGVSTSQVRMGNTVLADLDLATASVGAFAFSGPNGGDNNENFTLSSQLTNRVFAPGSYTITVTGDVDTASLANPARFSGFLTFNNASAVPEPTTWAMMLVGFGAVGYSMRNRPNRKVQLA
jgi:hypothetical protein